MSTAMAGRELVLETASTPSGFKANPVDWVRSRSSWKYTTDQWRVSRNNEFGNEAGEIVYQQPLARNGESMSIIRAGDWKDYSFSVDFQFTTHTIAPPEGGAILYFRYRNRKNYYSVHFCLATRRIEFWKRVAGEWQKVAIGAAIPFEVGRWYTAVVQTVGSRHDCYIDGHLAGRLEDADFPAGTAGIGAKFCGASFRRIRMTELEPEMVAESGPESLEQRTS